MGIGLAVLFLGGLIGLGGIAHAWFTEPCRPNAWTRLMGVVFALAMPVWLAGWVAVLAARGIFADEHSTPCVHTHVELVPTGKTVIPMDVCDRWAEPAPITDGPR